MLYCLVHPSRYISIFPSNWAYIYNNKNIIYAPMDDDRPCSYVNRNIKNSLTRLGWISVQFSSAVQNHDLKMFCLDPRSPTGQFCLQELNKCHLHNMLIYKQYINYNYKHEFYIKKILPQKYGFILLLKFYSYIIRNFFKGIVT